MVASCGKAARLCALGALLLWGCGHSKVSERSLAALPLEAKLDLIEAENDLFIAIDAVDETATRVLETKDEYDRSRTRIREAQESLKQAESGRDARHLEIAQLSLQESKQRRVWLDSSVAVQWALLDAEKARLELARARYERVQAQTVKKANVPGSEKINLADFDQRVASLEAKVKKASDSAQKQTQAADKIKGSWDETRRTLAQKTGGGAGSAWVE
jgi:hypothetical protein